MDEQRDVETELPALNNQRRIIPVQERWLWLFVGMISAVMGIIILSVASIGETGRFWGPIEAVDIEQSRIDVALPAPVAAVTVSQTFVPRHDGLSEIEVTLVRYGDEASAETGQLTLRLSDAASNLIAEETLATAELNHNQTYRLRFSPQPDSKNQPYILTLLGNADNTFSVWGYSLDVFAGGRAGVDAGPLSAEIPATDALDMRFRTRYQLSWANALTALAADIYYEGALILLALLVLPLPGLILLLIAARQRIIVGGWDAAAWLAVALALGMAAWPLLWQWLTLVGGRFWGWTLWIWVGLGWLVVIWMLIRQRRRPISFGLRFYPEHMLLVALLLLGFGVRLLAVRDVGFPLWVDSSRHALISEIMSETGQAIRSYGSYLPVERFPYHYGAHALAATLRLLSGWPIERLLLQLIQLFNALVPLTMYAAVVLVTRRRAGGLVAAFLVALPSFFPAYYVTWGRLTQMAAVVLLPILLAWTWQLLHGRVPWQKTWWLLSILVAGLFLIHFRIFVYFVPFVPLAWLIGRFRRTLPLLGAGAFGLLLIAPRVGQLLQDSQPANKFRESVSGFNEFPTTYLESGLEREFAWLIAAVVLLVLVSAVVGRRWAILPLTLIAWVALLFLLMAGDKLGLPETNLLTVNTLYIALFVPAGLLIGLLVDLLAQWLRHRHPIWQYAGLAAVGMIVGPLLLFGVRQQIEIVNDQTVLAHFEDQPALAWVDANLPDDALLAVNSWRWLGQTWAAGDGGAWLVPLTNRMTTTPPIDHIYNPELWAFVREFNETASAVDDWSDPVQADWLRQQGVGYVFVGKRGGFFDPAALSRNPQLKMVYQQNGTFVFELLP